MGDTTKVNQSAQQKLRRQPPWMKIEVKGSGGILLLGGIFIATAFAAVRMRRRAKTLPSSGVNSEDPVVRSEAVDEEKENCASLTEEEHVDEELLRESICEDVQEDVHAGEMDQNRRSSQKNSGISMDSMIDVIEVGSETGYSDIKEVLSDVCELHMFYQNEKNAGDSVVIDLKKEQIGSLDEIQPSNELQSEETNSAHSEEKTEEEDDLSVETEKVMEEDQHQQDLDGGEQVFLADSQLDMSGETLDESEFDVAGEETEENETITTESPSVDAETESASDVSSMEIQHVEVEMFEKEVLADEVDLGMQKTGLIQEIIEFEHVGKTNEDDLYAKEAVNLSKVSVDDEKDSALDTEEKEVIGGDAAPEFTPVKETNEEEKEALQLEPMQEETKLSSESLSVSSNAKEICPAVLMEEEKGEEVADSTDASSEELEIDDKVFSGDYPEEEEETCIIDEKITTMNSSSLDLENRVSFRSGHSHKVISVLLAAITLLIGIYLSQLLSTSVES